MVTGDQRLLLEVQYLHSGKATTLIGEPRRYPHGNAEKRRAFNRMGSAPKSLEVLHILAYEAEYPLHILTSAGRVKCTDRHLCHALLPIHFSVHLSLAARATAFYIALNSYYPHFSGTCPPPRWTTHVDRIPARCGPCQR